jgi:PleD family two-component response regulator
VIVRYGGDEFVCAMPGLTMAEATARVALVNVVLAKALEPGSITVGLTELAPGDSLDQLVARADSALYGARMGHRVPNA